MSTPTAAVVYPDSDGKPIADNTLQFRWIVTLQGNLDALFRDRPDVFVAGDHLIYPVEGSPAVCQAPDVYVAFGRPKGDRGSYRVFDEGGVFPQVVFEVLSPSNTAAEMDRKRLWYERYGAQEYYVYDPDDPALEGYRRAGDRLVAVHPTDGYVSPLLGIRFDLSAGPELTVFYPDGRPFRTFVELEESAFREQQRADRAAAEAVAARGEAVAARDRAEKLAAKLRQLGVDPDAV